MSTLPGEHPDGARVLVVDDDPDFREFVRIVLERHGYRVLEAADATDGLALMVDERPALVLLDAMISYELSGIKIVRAAREDPLVADIPMVLISAVLSEDGDRFLPHHERAMLNRFLTKPISPDALLAEVAGVLRKAGQQPPPATDQP